MGVLVSVLLASGTESASETNALSSSWDGQEAMARLNRLRISRD